MLLLILTLLLIVQLSALGMVLWGRRQMTQLPEASEVVIARQWPKLSIIVAARNEARSIEASLVSLLRSQYPDLEIVAVNDRSVDETTKILQRLSAADPRLKPIHIETLPPGWLGKNHALYQGALEARGEYFLFTDADVVFSPLALKRAVLLAEKCQLDHLCLLVGMRISRASLYPLIGLFGIAFSLSTRPWMVKNPRSKTAVGIGAFNLVRAAVYRSLDVHRKIRLRPDDDMKLAKVIKEAGYRTDCVSGVGTVEVEWYPGVGELVRGLEKNAFAAMEYSYPRVFLALFIVAVFYLFPFVSPFLWGTAERLVATIHLASLLYMYWFQVRELKFPFWVTFTLPWGALVLFYIFARAVALTTWRRGIYWRDTFYPLSELKKNRV